MPIILIARYIIRKRRFHKGKIDEQNKIHKNDNDSSNGRAV